MSSNILITGASGEVGHSMIEELSKNSDVQITAIDVSKPENSLSEKVSSFAVGSICEREFLENIFNNNYFDTVFHLAAVLSTGGEKNPEGAHNVNVQGTFNLLDMCQRSGNVVKFIFPSSIAAYGMPSLEIKNNSHPLTENEFLNPTTIYGKTKLYCESLGEYYSKYYKLLDESANRNIDFRCVRFPGLISATTLPTGGTSDYAPEMLHAAAQGKDYECFVRPDSTIPFMAMPDGSKALIDLANAKREDLKRSVYNIASFSISAKEIEEKVHKFFPDVKITYKPHEKRQSIVDSWPKEINDSKAKSDWGWKPNYDLDKTFEEYLIPTIRNRYK